MTPHTARPNCMRPVMHRVPANVRVQGRSSAGLCLASPKEEDPSGASRRAILAAGSVPLVLAGAGPVAASGAASSGSLPLVPKAGERPGDRRRRFGLQEGATPMPRRGWRAPAHRIPALTPRAADMAPGLSVSRIVKGCWQLSGGHKGDRGSDRTSGKGAQEDFALFREAGITTVDTADIYGPSEAIIGGYIKTMDADAAQRDLQVLTKCCFFSAGDMKNPSVDAIRKRVQNSTSSLAGRVPELVQLYWHDYRSPNYAQAAVSLTALKEEGLLRHVGATNFDTQRMGEMIRAGGEVVQNQVQYSLLDRRPAGKMTQFCVDKGVTLLPYGTVGGGFLSDRYLGMGAGEASKTINTYSKSKYASVIEQAGGWGWLQELLKTLREVADDKGTDISSVATRWVLDQPAVPAVIVGARNAEHVDAARGVFGFVLDGTDNAKIEAVLAKGRLAKGDCYEWERGGTW